MFCHIMHPKRSRRSLQEGAVLPVSLIFLVIFTMLGIAALNTTTLDTMMASNMQFQTRALIDAEGIITSAINDHVIPDIIETTANPADFNYDLAGDQYYDATTLPNITPSDWDWVFAYETVDDDDGNAIADFVVEYGGDNSDVLGEMGAYTTGGVTYTNHSFIITTRAQSSRGAQRIVQSVYLHQIAE